MSSRSKVRFRSVGGDDEVGNEGVVGVSVVCASGDGGGERGAVGVLVEAKACLVDFSSEACLIGSGVGVAVVGVVGRLSEGVYNTVGCCSKYFCEICASWQGVCIICISADLRCISELVSDIQSTNPAPVSKHIPAKIIGIV